MTLKIINPVSPNQRASTRKRVVWDKVKQAYVYEQHYDDAWQMLPTDKTVAAHPKDKAKDMRDVWIYGSPTANNGEGQSYAPYFDSWETAQVLQTSIIRLFGQGKRVWNKMCKTYNIPLKTLQDIAMHELYAKRNDIPDVHAYVGRKMNYTRRRISQLIQIMDIQAVQEEITNYFPEPNFFDVLVDDGDTTTVWQPSEKAIQREMVRQRRDCACGLDGCMGKTPNGKYALCRPCYEQYPHSNEHPHWLREEIKRIANDHRTQAIDRLYQKYHSDYISHADVLADKVA